MLSVVRSHGRMTVINCTHHGDQQQASACSGRHVIPKPQQAQGSSVRTFCVHVMRMQAPQPSLPAFPEVAMGLLRGMAAAAQYGQAVRFSVPKPHAPFTSP